MKPVKILIAEDDRATRQLLIEYLSQEGYEVIGANDGEDALGIIRRILEFVLKFSAPPEPPPGPPPPRPLRRELALATPSRSSDEKFCLLILLLMPTIDNRIASLNWLILPPALYCSSRFPPA